MLDSAWAHKLFGILSGLVHHPGLAETELGTLRWLVQLRVRIGLILLFVLFAVNIIRPLVWETTFALTLNGIAYLLFGAFYAFLLNGERAERYTHLVRNAQLPEKLTLCTLAVYFSGGVLTPVFLLYSLAIIEAIALMKPNGVYRMGATAVALYSILTLLESLRLIPHFTSSFGARDLYSIAVPTTYALHVIFVSCLLMLLAYMGGRVAHLIRYRNNLIETKLNDLRTLYNIANGLGNMMEEEALLRYLATTLKESQNASTCVIGLLDKEGRLQIKASAGMPPDKLAQLVKLSSITPGFDRLLGDGEPMVIEEIGNHPALQPYALGAGRGVSVHLYPIKSQSRVLGAISLTFQRNSNLKPQNHALERSEGSKLPTEYHELLTTVSSQVGVAIERARALSDAQRMAREMSALYDVGLQMGSTLSKAEVLKRTSDHIERLMKPDMHYIALYDAESEMITFETFVENGEPMPRMTQSVEKGGLTAMIVKTGEPLLVQDWLEKGNRYTSIAHKTGSDMLSYLGVPMLLDDRVVGVLSVQCVKPNEFGLQDQVFLSAMAAQTAMALENARLHQAVKEQAMYDSLTQIYNHGRFVEMVHQAVKESDRDDSNVALIMLDIDHFKKYNDTYGHVAGDNVLRMVASVLKSSVGEKGYAGRWGGEEFGILLVNTGLAEAKQMARHIRRVVSELSPVDGHGYGIPAPAISQGLSIYPLPSTMASELIMNADIALYKAKEQGRNQLVIYELGGKTREATATTDKLSLPKFTIDAGAATIPLHPTITTDHLGSKTRSN